MKLISQQGREDLAIVYVARSEGGNLVEFVESLHPPKPREDKWILTVSTLYGCPVNCTICDAGPYYLGRISKEGMFWQLDKMISGRYPDSVIPVNQLKVHFTRMGEPTFNMAVLDVINEFEWYWQAPGFMPSISTIAPNGSEKFLDELVKLKNQKFRHGKFQLQFSIHTTDKKKRDLMMPVKKWSFQKMAEYGKKFFGEGDRKISLSFAPSAENEIDIDKLKNIFDPEIFIIKLTPLNETESVIKNQFTPLISNENNALAAELAAKFENFGYEAIISFNNNEEIKIGSTCGQNLFFTEKP